MLLCVFRLVRALDAGGVDEPRDRRAAQDVRLHDLRKVFLLHAGVPDVLRIEHHHRAVAALGEAARFVDADVSLAPGLRDLGAELLHEAFDVPLRRAVVAARAHEDVRFVLAHQLAAPAVFAALRSATNLSTSSRIALTIWASGTLRITSPPLKMSPIPRPPATPISAARASPGPFTSHPITAM